MDGDIFRFKGFSIYQGKSTMRVNTDGILLGAWSDTETKIKVLDVGTGTGLIALMLAFKHSLAQITAIDIDQYSIEVARFNITYNGFSNRMQAIHCSLQHFSDITEDKFDLIVSNPPYFYTGTKPGNARKKLVRHTTYLPHKTLIDCVAVLLKQDGSFNVILPYSESVEFQNHAKSAGMHLQKSTEVHSKKDRPVQRVLMKFGFNPCMTSHDKLFIHDPEKPEKYSKDYIQLTKDYYLFM